MDHPPDGGRGPRLGTVLYLTGFFPPEVVAKRAWGVTRALAGAGYRVTVVTRWPTALSGRACAAAEVDAADRALPPGVQVRRLRVAERRSASPGWRILSQASFALRAAALALRLVRRHDVVVAYTPPPFLGVAAWTAARAGRRPLVLEVQDLYPAQAVALGVVDPGLLVRWARGVERLLYRGARRLVVVTEGYRRHVVDAGADPARVRVVPNTCDTGAFRPDVTPLEAPWPRAPFTAVFAGTVGLAQGSEVILDAAEALRDRGDVGFEIWGGGARYAALRADAERRGLDRVRFGPALGPGDMPRVLTRGDVLLLTLHPDPVFARVIPSKLSEYLAAGRPVVAAARGEVADLLAEGGAGVAVPPRDGPALAAALRCLADDPGERARLGAGARRLAVERFDDGAAHAALRAIVAEAMGGDGAL